MTAPQWIPDFADDEGRIRTLVYIDRDRYKGHLYPSDIHVGAMGAPHVNQREAMDDLVALVRDHAAVTQERDEWRDVAHAYHEANPGMSAEEMVAHLRERMDLIDQLTQERDALRAVVRRIVKDIPDLMFTDDEGDIWIGVDALPLAEKDAARAALGDTA